MIIDIGDIVKHRPTGEKWLVALVDDKDIYYCGYPFGGFGSLEDCELIKKATKLEREKVIRDLCNCRGSQRPVFAARKTAANEGITI
jgi:hypothetical protein